MSEEVLVDDPRAIGRNDVKDATATLAVELPKEPTKASAMAWPTYGRNAAVPPIQRTLMRMVFGHPRLRMPCVSITGVPSLDFFVDVQCGDSPAESFTLRSGFCDEWLDLPLDDVPEALIVITVRNLNGQTLGHAAILGVELGAQSGCLRKAFLVDGRVRGQVILEYTLTSPLVRASAAQREGGISDVCTPRLVGHRGMGANGTSPYEENTVLSFITAMKNGVVSHVELDVQLTRDGVPVIHHDFCVSLAEQNAGKDMPTVDVPVYALNLDEWKRIRPLPRAGVDDSGYGSDSDAPRSSRARPLARRPSDNKLDDMLPQSGSERTNGGSAGRPSGAGYSRKRIAVGAALTGRVTDELPTLRTIFDSCPTNVGFMIELKYPILEWQEEKKLPFPRRDEFVSRVLETVFDATNNSGRSVIFLTFDADLAMMLKLKQVRYPVYFLTCDSEDPVCECLDPRAALAEGAVAFAHSAGFDGNVFLANVVLRKPQLLQLARSKALSVMTYGRINSDAEAVKKQLALGVQGVIADNVNMLLRDMPEMLEHREDNRAVKPSSVLFDRARRVPVGI